MNLNEHGRVKAKILKYYILNIYYINLKTYGFNSILFSNPN